ncbi:MAG: DUF2325 domain-containing protein [Clostridia bacterium]|nr:DUF2325 domain-containing protein [Clostridia bacterium]
MSVVIVGGNDRMVRRYKEICEQYKCRAKVFTQMSDGIVNKIGSPDLLVLFTGTTSHKMIGYALNATKGLNTIVARSHSSSAAALKSILQIHAKM